jgi:hypothetical protein
VSIDEQKSCLRQYCFRPSNGSSPINEHCKSSLLPSRRSCQQRPRQQCCCFKKQSFDPTSMRHARVLRLPKPPSPNDEMFSLSAASKSKFADFRSLANYLAASHRHLYGRDSDAATTSKDKSGEPSQEATRSPIQQKLNFEKKISLDERPLREIMNLNNLCHSIDGQLGS